MAPVKIIIIGAGSRGGGFATFAEAHPEKAQVAGVAEPREPYRNKLAAKHRIPAENIALDWREFADREKFADAVIITTQDAMHVEPAVAFAKKGYQILLEKPMAPNEADCRRIADAARSAGIIFAVGHVMRYTSYTKELKAILDADTIGEIVSIQHLEPVGYWHQAHSFVRGNWRNEKESSPMLLAKSCHDLDWLRYIAGAKCRELSSFGSLRHFRREAKPHEAGGATRCVNCDYESRCPYSALKIYIGMIREGHTGWPVSILTPTVSEDSVMAVLETGPYGRCVYECDNDVVDHQVVNMVFENDVTAVFTMTAFTELGHRKTRIFGTRGQIEGDGSKIRHFDFLTDHIETIDTDATGGSILGGHGGGDYSLMSSFVDAVAANDPSKVLSGPEESLETHLMVFAAEKARLGHKVVRMQ